ncbi:MAG TPA: hypothetical protein VIG97_03310 [Luteimonas sp.]
MNARLLVKSLHRPALVSPPRPVRPANDEPLQLLGEGTDAVLMRMTPDVQQPTPETRMLRYLRAVHIHRAGRDTRMDSLRTTIGTAFQMAWREGRRPNLRLMRPMTLRPVGLP